MILVGYSAFAELSAILSSLAYQYAQERLGALQRLRRAFMVEAGMA